MRRGAAPGGAGESEQRQEASVARRTDRLARRPAANFHPQPGTGREVLEIPLAENG